MEIECECVRQLQGSADPRPLDVEIALLAAAREAAKPHGVTVRWTGDTTLQLSRRMRVTRWRATAPDEITLRQARRTLDADAQVGDEVSVPLVPHAPSDEVADALDAFQRSPLHDDLAAALRRQLEQWCASDTARTPRFVVVDGWRVYASLRLERPRLREPTPYSLWQAVLDGADFDRIEDDAFEATIDDVVPRIDYVVGQIHNGGVSQLLYNAIRGGVSMQGLSAALRSIGADAAAAALDGTLEALPSEELEAFLESDYFGENAQRDALDAASDALAAEVEAIEAAAAHWLWARREDPEVAAAYSEAERPEQAEAVRTATTHADLVELRRLHETGVPAAAFGAPEVLGAAVDDPNVMRALLQAGAEPRGVASKRGPIVSAPACRALFDEFGYPAAGAWHVDWHAVDSIDEVNAAFSNGHAIRNPDELTDIVWSRGRDEDANLRLLALATEAGVRAVDAADGGALALRNMLEQPRLLRAFLDTGVDPNAAQSGCTALFDVETVEAAEVLLAAGADPNYAATEPVRSFGDELEEGGWCMPGSTPLDVARARGRSDIVRCLEAHGGRAGRRTAWGVVLVGRGFEDQQLLDCLGDTPELRDELSRVPREGDDALLDGRVVAGTDTEEAARVLADELAALGATVEIH